MTHDDAEKITGFDWFLLLLLTFVGRIIVLVSGSISFHSDEAVVALMARHINQGQPIPTFFYGQHYMGSLDALIVAGFFRVFGENVGAIRLAQSALYVSLVVVAVLFAQQLTRRRAVSMMAGALVAVPPVVLTLYSSMTLGGYGETLLLGTLILMLGWALRTGQGKRWHWVALGLLAGLGWWTNALIVVYLLPVALYLIVAGVHLTPRPPLRIQGGGVSAWKSPSPLAGQGDLGGGVSLFGQLFRRNDWPHIGIALIGFFVGGSPWWIYNLQHEWAAMRWLLNNSQANQGIVLPLGDRILGFLFVGLPSVLGLRYPWAADLWASAASIGIVLVFIAVLLFSIRRAIRSNGVERYLMIMIGCFTLVFVGSQFGADITGRYLLPLCVPLAILTACWLDQVGRRLWWFGLVVLPLLIGFQTLGNGIAMGNPPGLTSQWDLVNHIPNEHDEELIAFLKAHNGTRGFGTYWMTFRLAFLSQETVIIDAWLPNKLSMIYTPADRRWPPYTEAVLTAERPVYITANVPELERRIADGLKALNVAYQREQIGAYVVFYDLSRRILPGELEH